MPSEIVESLDAEEILFVPDQYLGHYVATKTGKKMILWPGYCPTHARIQPQDITRLKAEYPQAKVVVHPECRPEVIALADAVLSTGGIIRFARETEAREIIVGTEIGHTTPAEKRKPGQEIYSGLRAGSLPQNEANHPGDCPLVSGEYGSSGKGSGKNSPQGKSCRG